MKFSKVSHKRWRLLATQFNNTEVTQVSLETGASVDQPSDGGWTALQDSAIYNRTDTDTIRILISHKCLTADRSKR